MATSRHPYLADDLPWEFPATEVHAGIPLSNATFGALMWGGGGRLKITINRADYWDHRGGIEFSEEASYENLKRWIEEGDEERLRCVFEGTARDDSTPRRPTRLPMGRTDLRWAKPLRLSSGALDLAAAEARVALEGDDEQASATAFILPDDPVLVVTVAGAQPEIALCPPDAPEVVEHFRRYGFPPAERFEEDEFFGWVQECPGEPALCVGCLKTLWTDQVELLVTAVYGDTPEQARTEASAILARANARGVDELRELSAEWWRRYWLPIAALDIPDPTASLLYYLGMYKLAGLSRPGSPAATLQGPWIEEHRLPPWSGDYHFNINVQESYWPAYGGNYLAALEPLFELVRSWEPRLRHNARVFAGLDDGLMLPHAVDDRCTCMGGFWTGAIDHGSTAWTGQLMWLYYKYTLDEDFLRETAYPFLRGAMRVYEAMLEDDGEAWSLPVSVSPEFGGAGADAWGRNASFQIAIVHFLCRALSEASALLGVDADLRERWEDIERRLPLGALSPDGGELHLWEGQPLSESHRHHSHLAGLYPFDIFDLDDETQRGLVHRSLATLTRMGMGAWSGWCLPWAAILQARIGHGDMAALILEIFRRTFMGPGYFSTHDARFAGLTLIAGRPDIMQIEAAMGAAAAVMEMLVHTRQEVVHVFPAVPETWAEASFEGLRTEGAFLVTAERAFGHTMLVRILSERGALLKLANPFAPEDASRIHADGQSERLTGDVLELPTEPGEVIELRPAPCCG